MASAVAPVAVSPLIKFCRYTALFSGILYGHFRYKSLSKKEVIIQEEENKIRAIRDARIKQETDAAVAAEMAVLGKEFGVTK
ncbi:ATP synthase subunit e, mitochondrial [Octopus sinensis]|uniref:ATP synthase F(0) complex subunit e, mitochondrial n=1 Tax=Octopus sinensis TaxID=2607531 RepID=A0A6P7T308_9MOLL|nr:ATP synthase subunit e, mitochondrial [Octopus sinensis]